MSEIRYLEEISGYFACKIGCWHKYPHEHPFDEEKTNADNAKYYFCLKDNKWHSHDRSCFENRAHIKLGQQDSDKSVDMGKDDLLELARNYEKALRYEDAAKLYEKLKMWDDAGRVRKKINEHQAPQTKIDIGEIDRSVSISDSVIHKSTVSGDDKKKINICPYCGETLNFPETPRFCPFCEKQILM